MSETKLLPCPFCGGKAFRKTTFPTDEDGLELNMFSVGCETCGIEFSWLWNSEIPVELWNTRKPVEDVLERLEELHKKSEECPKFEKVFRQVAFEETIEIIKEGLME